MVTRKRRWAWLVALTVVLMAALLLPLTVQVDVAWSPVAGFWVTSRQAPGRVGACVWERGVAWVGYYEDTTRLPWAVGYQFGHGFIVQEGGHELAQ